MKYAVQAVILNDKGEVLAVSRKDNHEDMGLVGGKVDPEDLNPEEAMAREAFEETGLRINTATMQVVFQMHKDGYMGITYLIKQWSGEIQTDEPHVVEWVPFEVIMNGTFGKWNTMVAESLTSMGIEFLKRTPIDMDYYFHTSFDEDDGGVIVTTTPKHYWESDGCVADHYSDEDWTNMHNMVKDAGFVMHELMESVWEITKDGKSVEDIVEVGKLMLAAGFKKNEDFSKFLAD